MPQGAEVWINDKKVETLFTSRLSESPELKAAGTYVFDVRVTWKENGEVIEEKRVLGMKQGDFRRLQYIGWPTPWRR